MNIFWVKAAYNRVCVGAEGICPLLSVLGTFPTGFVRGDVVIAQTAEVQTWSLSLKAFCLGLLFFQVLLVDGVKACLYFYAKNQE